ncbi:MAG: phosphoribosylglycinamide formyltransferase [Bacteroidales bacterium]
MESKIAIFASGNGTNMQGICDYFQNSVDIHPSILFCNCKDAFVLQRAKQLSLPTCIISKQNLNDPNFMLPILQKQAITHLVLAGFLCLIPPYLVQAYPKHILNIHPALLPLYGGKGMYGSHVHEAVVKNKEKESGISIHYIDEHYDQGNLLFQARCEVKPNDSPETLAARIHELEQKYFPIIIEKWIKNVL